MILSLCFKWLERMSTLRIYHSCTVTQGIRPTVFFCKFQYLYHTSEIYLPMILKPSYGEIGLQRVVKNVSASRDIKMCQTLSLYSFILLNLFILDLSSKCLMTCLLLIWIQFFSYYSVVGFHNWSMLTQITCGWASLLQDSLGSSEWEPPPCSAFLYFKRVVVFNIYNKHVCKNIVNIFCFPGVL